MTVGFQSVWQKCKCPIYASQDGVCGCPQFWKRKDIPSAPPTKTTTSAQNNIDAQPGATHKSRPGLNDKDGKGVETSCETSKCVGPPQETCFFWYHGTCHRGSDCNFAHESHITWPITAPPKFVHFEPCNLPLCPLRQDLAVLMEDPRRGRSVWRSRFDGQLDGAAASFLGRETSNEATSSDIDSANTGNKELDENMDLGAAPIQSLIDPSSRPLDGSYSDSNSDLSEIGKSEEGDHTEQQDRNDVASSTPQIDDMDYFDLSGCKPLPPSSDIGEQVILSLSHPGTLGKRNCGSVSSPDREESECKRAKVEGKQESKDATRQPEELTRDTTSFETEHTTDAMDVTDNHTNYPTFSARPLHHLPPKPESPAPDLLLTNMQQPTPPRPHGGVPTGPRALGGGAPVCFYWYHKGHCNPKMRRNGQLIQCNYTHSLDGPCPQVSLPPNITDHDPFCPLPLCPVPRTQPLPIPSNRSNSSADNLRKETDRRWDKSRKNRGANARHSPIPRETMLGRHVVTRDRGDNGRRNRQKPPQLSGPNSESVGVRKNTRKNGQKHKGNDPGGMNRHREGRKPAKAPMRKHAHKAETYGRLKKEEPVLDYGDVSPQNLQAKSSAVPVDHNPQDDGHLSFLEQLSTELSRPGWMNHAQSVANSVGENKNGVTGEEGSSLQIHSDTGMEDSVDHAPSAPEPRLDWDTDEVRRLFGDID